MDFVMGLPLTRTKYDAAWIVVDRFTKSAHFFPIQVDYSMEKLVEIYIKEVIRLHGVASSIIFDKVP